MIFFFIGNISKMGIKKPGNQRNDNKNVDKICSASSPQRSKQLGKKKYQQEGNSSPCETK